MRRLAFAIAAAALLAPLVPLSAQSDATPARSAIDAGNRAWIDGVKAGDVKRIMATYAEDAVDCGPTGECVRGRQEIARHMTIQLTSLGPARSAAVRTWGSSENGNFVYEWGLAEATFGGEKKLAEKYLTAWQRQPDGSWKIFRNMVIPEE